MVSQLKGYKKRIEKRRRLASKIGRSAFYTSKANGMLPYSWYTLVKMANRGRIQL